MRKVGLVLTILFASTAQADYWQQRVACKIQATLNDSTRVISGVEKLVYWNNSPDTLKFVYFYAYPTAPTPSPAPQLSAARQELEPSESISLDAATPARAPTSSHKPNWHANRGGGRVPE